MAGTIIDMSKIKQLLHLKKAGVSNRQIAKDLKMSRDKANEYVNRAESDPLGIDGLLKLDDPVLEKRFHRVILHTPMSEWRRSWNCFRTLLSSCRTSM